MRRKDFKRGMQGAKDAVKYGRVGTVALSALLTISFPESHALVLKDFALLFRDPNDPNLFLTGAPRTIKAKRLEHLEVFEEINLIAQFYKDYQR